MKPIHSSSPKIIHVNSLTELCQNGDLDMYVTKRGVLDENTAAKFIKDIFEGLLYLASDKQSKLLITVLIFDTTRVI